MLVRTRYFLVGSALIVVVGLCAGLVAYYNGSLPLRSSTIGPAELAYVPAGTSGVAYANVREIMNSEFRRKLQQMLPAGAEKERLLGETGIDLERDIDTVVAAVSGTDRAAGAIVLLRGRFDAARIEAVAVGHGATTESYGGKHVVVFQRGPGSPGASLAFLEPGLVALGELAALRLAIDASTTRDSAVRNPELMNLVAHVDGAGNAWAIGRLDVLADNRVVPDQVRRVLPAVQWLSASFDVGRTVNGRLRADTPDQQSGDQLRSVVTGALAVARVMAGKDARLDAALNSIHTGGSGPTVEVTFTVPPEMIDLIHAPGERGPRAPSPPR